jgi:hypothetical protein
MNKAHEQVIGIAERSTTLRALIELVEALERRASRENAEMAKAQSVMTDDGAPV